MWSKQKNDKRVFFDLGISIRDIFFGKRLNNRVNFQRFADTNLSFLNNCFRLLFSSIFSSFLLLYLLTVFWQIICYIHTKKRLDKLQLTSKNDFGEKVTCINGHELNKD
jgi:hypothetical protein